MSKSTTSLTIDTTSNKIKRSLFSAITTTILTSRSLYQSSSTILSQAKTVAKDAYNTPLNNK